MLDVDVIAAPEAAAAALDPIKARLLAELVRPASAATLSARVGIPRQKINYHLRVLEAHGLVHVAEQRRWGGLTERLMVASAGAYLVSPEALGPIAADPARMRDEMSAGYAIAVGARIVRELGALWRRARREEKRLATLTIDTEIVFRSAADRADFTRDAAAAIATLAARYHDAAAPGGRPHRLCLVAYASPPQNSEDQTCH